MAGFMGGSAAAMAKRVAEGFLLVTVVTLKRMTVADLDQLQFEFEKLQRELRAEPSDQDDLPALQLKNRKISRIENGLRVLRGTKQQIMKHRV